MGVYVETNIYSRTWNCTITKQIHASCAILFITKKKSRAHPKISRARAQSIWTMKLKINNPVVGMGTNNRRGNVFELKLSWSFLYFFLQPMWPTNLNTEFRPPIFKWQGQSLLLIFQCSSSAVFAFAIRKLNYKRWVFKDGWAGIVQGHNRTTLNRRSTLWKHRDINCFWYVCLLVFWN